jgi:hypothetical protein
MDGKAFISEIETDFESTSPILSYAIRKQLAEIGTTPEDLTPKEAMQFIERMTDAMEMFLGKSEAIKKRNFMMTLLRRQAPEYFESISPV